MEAKNTIYLLEEVLRVLGKMEDNKTKFSSYFLRVYKKYNLRAKRLSHRKGQHFLIDESVIKREVQIANIQPDDIVLEIGAGLGFLTMFLVKKAEKVIAIELDKTFFNILNLEFSLVNNLTLIRGDVLKTTNLPPFTKIVSNIPYSITSPLFEKMALWNFTSATLIIQSDVAKRLLAKPKTREYGKLTVFINSLFEIYLFDIIYPHSFYPPPRVTSQIIKLVPLKKRYTWTPIAKAILMSLFNRKHKKVRNNLKFFYAQQHLPDATIQKIKDSLSQYLDQRCVNLSTEEILDIIDDIIKIVVDDSDDEERKNS